MISHGILLLDKPPGESSFAALYPVKRAFGGKKGAKIGHAGTLDPAASGLLVIGVGAGTRLLEFLEAMPKSYRFRLNLGVTTDTYDLEGEILERRDASAVTRAQVEALLGGFLGSISQMPPAYSAIKIQGKRACDRVRDGETVTLTARQVRIDRLAIIAFEPGSAIMEMDCSKGTYVRSLAHDLGQLLGCGAVADQIRRTAIGPFRVEDAVAPDSICPEALIPLERAVAHLPALCVKESWRAGLRDGNPIPAAGYKLVVENPPPTGANAETVFAVFSEQGALLCLATVNTLGQLCPRKVFPEAGILA
jgi:tRNA pseudouridine55 synthase